MPRHRLPLRGADLALMEMHSRWRRTGLSNNAIAVIECDGPIDAERVRGSVKRLLGECPWPAARLRRTLPWGRLERVEQPRRGLSVPAVRRRVCRSPEELHLELESELKAGIDPRRESPVRVLLAECDGNEPLTSALVLTWFHPFMDPRFPSTLGSIFGRRVVNAYHAPAVLPRPGIGCSSTAAGRSPTWSPRGSRARLIRTTRGALWTACGTRWAGHARHELRHGRGSSSSGTADRWAQVTSIARTASATRSRYARRRRGNVSR